MITSPAGRAVDIIDATSFCTCETAVENAVFRPSVIRLVLVLANT